jgi:hypothetical protein
MKLTGVKTSQTLWKHKVVAKRDAWTAGIWHGFLAASNITRLRDSKVLAQALLTALAVNVNWLNPRPRDWLAALLGGRSGGGTDWHYALQHDPDRPRRGGQSREHHLLS